MSAFVNGAVLGVVFSLHAALLVLLFVVRAPPEILARSHPPDVFSGRPMTVSFPAERRGEPPAIPKMLLPTPVSPSSLKHSSAAHHRATREGVVSSPIVARFLGANPSSTPRSLVASPRLEQAGPLSASATPSYIGNPAFQRRGEQNLQRGFPELPGQSFSRVLGIKLAPMKSVRSSVMELRHKLICSNIQGEMLSIRGSAKHSNVTEQQLNQAYRENGCGR